MAGAGVYLPASERPLVDGKTSLRVVVLKLLVLVFICLLLSLRLRVRFGERQKSMVMLVWSVAVLLCLFLKSCRLFSVQNSGVLLFCHAGVLACHLGIDNPYVTRSICRLLDHGSLIKPLPLVQDGDLIALVQYMIRTRSRDTVRVTEVKGMLRMLMSSMVWFGLRIRLGMLKLILPLTWVVVISLRFSLMLGVGCLRLVVSGILL